MTPIVILVDDTNSLNKCLADIASESVTKLAIDLEGVDLCRYGRIAILQIFADTSDTIWLVDITILGKLAFDHKDAQGRCLKNILENENTKKILYDVRNDADALFNLYTVELRNTYDLQLLEVAARRSSNIRVKFVSGLGKTIDVYLSPPAAWKRVKDTGASLFAPERGGSYDVFEKRPLDERILAYAAQDVALLFDLESVLESRLGLRSREDWKKRVLRVSASRVAEARSQFYSGKGQHRAIAPSL